MASSQFSKNAIINILLITFVLLNVGLLTVHASDKSSKMTNNANGLLFSQSKVDSPSNYFHMRNQSLNLIRAEKWIKAKPLLVNLVSQYPDDGDTWYLLALCYFQLEEWQNAIDAYRRTIALGTILSNIPKSSAPSNDLMVKIAEAFAELNNESDALYWLNKAFEARYDEKHLLANNLHFRKIAESVEFKKTIGTYLPSNVSRVESWKFDLKYLISEINRLHVNKYHAVSESTFKEMIENIEAEIPLLTDQEIVFKFMQLVSLLGNGHNFIIPTFNEKGAFNQLPLQFYHFSDGVFVVDADSDYKDLIGSRLIKIANVPTEKALSKINQVNARDNEMQRLWLGPHYLTLPQVLHGVGIVNDTSTIPLLLENSEGKYRTVWPSIRPMKFNGFPKLPALTNNNSIHNLVTNKPYWFKKLPKQSSLYLQYNYVQNDPILSFDTFNKDIKKQFAEPDIQHMILDIRHNAGGDGSKYPPLLKTLVQFEALNPDGKLFIIVGRNTFSAAHNLLVDIERLTNAIIVGEPSGSRPNALGEAGWFKLPYSKTLGIISSQYHQASKAEDHRVWVAPDVPVSLSSFDYFSGNDPALEAIFNIINLK